MNRRVGQFPEFTIRRINVKMKSAEELIKGTRLYEIYKQTEKLYNKIQISQAEWYKKTGIVCPQGCGECCKNFEPDLLECEAIYMSIWLLKNQNETAQKVMCGEFPFSENKGCPFWNENSSYHCTIYGGRAFICRLFGASGFYSKNGETVWKPCKFYPAEKLSQLKIPFFHRQYSKKELCKRVNVVPPVMSDFMQQAIEITPEHPKTTLLRKILPKTLKYADWIFKLKQQNIDNDNNLSPKAS